MGAELKKLYARLKQMSSVYEVQTNLQSTLHPLSSSALLIRAYIRKQPRVGLVNVGQ